MFTLYWLYVCLGLLYCTLLSAGFRGARVPPPKSAPTMFLCLAMCATSLCHLVIYSEESLFADVISYQSVCSSFLVNIVWYCDETTITITGFLKVSQVSESSECKAEGSHVKRISLCPYSVAYC